MLSSAPSSGSFSISSVSIAGPANTPIRRHPEHALYLSDKLIKMYMVMRIFYAVKFNNRDLTRFGKPSVKRAGDGRKMQKIMHL
jgi:hypothetical protein